MREAYSGPLTTPQPAVPISKLHAALAARDGWSCAYCGHQLAHGTVGWQHRVLGPCPGGHRDVYPCDAGCEGGIIFTLLPGYRVPHADHVVPRAKGGRDHIDNRVLACDECNIAKRADTVLVFLARQVSA